MTTRTSGTAVMESPDARIRVEILRGTPGLLASLLSRASPRRCRSPGTAIAIGPDVRSVRVIHSPLRVFDHRLIEGPRRGSRATTAPLTTQPNPTR